jgi:microsomal epoxide hydrolase
MQLGRMTDYTVHADVNALKGGHFAALERPDELKTDMTKFIDQVWPGIVGAK